MRFRSKRGRRRLIGVLGVAVVVVGSASGANAVAAGAAASDDATTTVVTCSPAAVNTGTSLSCNAYVQDRANGWNVNEGAVQFSSPSGTFRSASCILPEPCFTTFTPSGPGTHTITASYSGAGWVCPGCGSGRELGVWSASTATTQVSVTSTGPQQDPTNTIVSCSWTQASATCTATVTDTKDPGSKPTGTIFLWDAGCATACSPGAYVSFENGHTCSASSCTVTVHTWCTVFFAVCASAGTERIAAAYEGDPPTTTRPGHATSWGTASLTAATWQIECLPLTLGCYHGVEPVGQT